MDTSCFDDLDEAWVRAKGGVKWHLHGPDVLAAWVADMDFPIPPVVRDALVGAAAGGDLGYPDWPHGSPLREALALRMEQRYRWRIDPSRVRELTDIIQGLQLALHLASEPGDAVAIHTPAYPPFLASIEAMGRRLVPLSMQDTPDGWRLDPERAEAAIVAANCRVLVLVNPHNPTGRVLTLEELSTLAAIAERRGLVVVADEVHAELAYPPHRHIPFGSLDEASAARTITLTSATKAFNLAAIRCALVHIGPEPVLKARDAQPSQLFGQPSALAVTATLAAWAEGDPWLTSVMTHLDRNRRLVADSLAQHLPTAHLHLPEATYLAWMDLRPLGLGPDPAAHLLARGKVALSRGPEFGPEGVGFARLNFATSRGLLDKVLERVVLAAQSPPGGYAQEG